MKVPEPKQYVASYSLKERGKRQAITFSAYDTADAIERVELMKESLVFEGPAEELEPKF